MAPVSNEQFLFCCIANSNGGKVDWAKVAEECDIPSKGAAAIKYRRMQEKFGTVGSNGTASPKAKDGTPAADEEKSAKKGKKASNKTLAKSAVGTPVKKGGNNKKRKLADASPEPNEEPEADAEEPNVKVEEDADE